MFYEQFKKAQEQGVEKNFKFKITFSFEQNLQGKKLKRAIDDHHYLTLKESNQNRLLLMMMKIYLLNLMINLLVLRLVFRYLKYLMMKNIKEK